MAGGAQDDAAAVFEFPVSMSVAVYCGNAVDDATPGQGLATGSDTANASTYRHGLEAQQRPHETRTDEESSEN